MSKATDKSLLLKDAINCWDWRAGLATCTGFGSRTSGGKLGMSRAGHLDGLRDPRFRRQVGHEPHINKMIPPHPPPPRLIS